MTIATPREGSRKLKVFETFKAKGPEAAFAHGTKLQLTPATLRTWLWTWSKTKKRPAKRKAA